MFNEIQHRLVKRAFESRSTSTQRDKRTESMLLTSTRSATHTDQPFQVMVIMMTRMMAMMVMWPTRSATQTDQSQVLQN